MAVQSNLPAPPAAVLAQLDLNSLLDMPSASVSASDALPHHHADAAHQLSSPQGSHEQVQSENAEVAALNNPQLTATAAAYGDGDTQMLSQFDLEALKQAVSQDPDADVHASLYHMLLQCEADAAEWESDGKTMLEESGHQQVLQSLELAHFDLCYNFHRYESWEKLLSKSEELVCGSPCDIVFSIQKKQDIAGTCQCSKHGINRECLHCSMM